MAVLFNEVVKVKRTSCKKCLSLLYTIPCRVDKELATFLVDFGEPVYPLKTIKLLRIDSKDGYKIESKIGKNAVKFALPKNLEGEDLDKASRKIEFETRLTEWMSEKLDILIERE